MNNRMQQREQRVSQGQQCKQTQYNQSLQINQQVSPHQSLSSNQSLSANHYNRQSNITIYHSACNKYLAYHPIVQLIHQYLHLIYQPISQQQTNINKRDKDIKQTCRCCINLEMSSVFDKINQYCLKCQQSIIKLHQSYTNQHQSYTNKHQSPYKLFHNNNIVFCTKCIHQLSMKYMNNINEDKSNRQIDYLLYRILVNCQNQLLQQQQQVDSTQLNQISKQPTNQLSQQYLNSLSIKQLINIIMNINKERLDTSYELQRSRQQLIIKNKHLQLNLKQINQLKQQNNLLKSKLSKYQNEISSYKSKLSNTNSDQLILTYNLHTQKSSQLYTQKSSQLYTQKSSQLHTQKSSQLHTQKSSQLHTQKSSQLHTQKSQISSQLVSSIKQSDIQQNKLQPILSKFKQQQQRQNSLLHPQRETYLHQLDPQQIKHNLNFLCSQHKNTSQLSSIFQQQSQQQSSSTHIHKPITRSQVKHNLSTINTHQNHNQQRMIATLPVNNTQCTHKIKRGSQILIPPVSVTIKKQTSHPF